MSETQTTQESEVNTQDFNTEQQQVPVFDEAGNMNNEQALNVLVQAASMAQSTGKLTVRDSVLLAKAIDVLRPGTI